MLPKPCDIGLVQRDLPVGLQHRQISLDRSQKNLLLGGSVTRFRDIEPDSAKSCILVRLAAVIQVPAQADRGVDALRIKKPALCRALRIRLVLVAGQRSGGTPFRCRNRRADILPTGEP